MVSGKDTETSHSLDKGETDWELFSAWFCNVWDILVYDIKGESGDLSWSRAGGSTVGQMGTFFWKIEFINEACAWDSSCFPFFFCNVQHCALPMGLCRLIRPLV